MEIFISMFKYLSDILSKFSPQQRLLALVILLSSILLITFGGKIIDSFNSGTKPLQRQITRLKSENTELSNQLDTLRGVVLANELQCSEDILEVRRKILDDLGILERNVMNQMRLKENTSHMMGKRMEIGTGDTMVASSPIIHLPDTETEKMMLKGIRDLKERIKTD